MSEQHEISQLVTAVFRAWQQAGINCLVLRNYESLPHFTTNDIDVLVDPAQLRQAEQALLEAAAKAGFRLHNRVEFATLALYLSSRQSNAQAHFDLFTALKWRGFEFLSCREFLAAQAEPGPLLHPPPGGRDRNQAARLAHLHRQGQGEVPAAIAAGLPGRARGRHATCSPGPMARRTPGSW